MIAHSRIFKLIVREAKLYLSKTEPYFTVLWPTCTIFYFFTSSTGGLVPTQTTQTTMAMDKPAQIETTLYSWVNQPTTRAA